MKLAVFGATGRTGKQLVQQALAAGHSVTALVRAPAKLALLHERLIVIAGDAQDAAAVAKAVAGAEAVLSVLAPSTNQPVFAVSRSTINILDAMQQHGVRRLVISTGAGVADPHDQPQLFHRLMGGLVKLLARNVYADMARVVAVVRQADVDWTIVRVPMLTDDPQTGRVRAGYVGAGPGPRLARADLADFMLRQAQDLTYLRQAPAIGGSTT